MLFYKNILVPVDGTPASEEVIRFICTLQTVIPGNIHVVYVVEVPRSLPLNECPPQKVEEARRVLKASELIADECGACVQTQIIYARTAEDSILVTAEDLKCDMIALAQNNQKFRLFANNALNIYQRAKCNVWLINMKEIKNG